MSGTANKVGAVMVVGGSMAGVQASLDLADMGYYVYLVERCAAVLGREVQSNRDSLAGDSSMCPITHKLNDVAGHSNIQIITTAEVLEITGEPGHMKAEVHIKPHREAQGEAIGAAEDPPTAGEVIRLEMGAVVLASGPDMEPSAKSLGVQWTGDGRASISSFDPMATSRPGIYACRRTEEPENISFSLMKGSAAASAAASGLPDVRFTMTKPVKYPEERDRSAERPRIGVFICDCGSSLNDVDMTAVAEYAGSLPFVEYCGKDSFACSRDVQAKMGMDIQEYRLNRVVIGCFSPEADPSMFEKTLLQAGLSRAWCQLAHLQGKNRTADSMKGTESTRIKNLIRAAVVKVALYSPMNQTVEGMTKAALIVGGGVAGMTAALVLAEQAYPVCLVEQSSHLAGNPSKAGRTRQAEDAKGLIEGLVKKVKADKQIEVYTDSEVLGLSGYLGNFKTRIKTPGGEITFLHGAAIMATGGDPINPEGFVQEAHMTTRPVDSSKEGIFLADLSQYPRPVDESVIQARAAAVRVLATLAKDKILVTGVAPSVSKGECAACLTCVRTCPCGVPYIGEKGYAEIEPAICRGCGTCMTECPGKAISLRQYSDDEMLSKLEMFRCSACGQPYLTAARLEYLKRKLPARDIQHLDKGLCPACSRRKGAEDQAALTPQP